LVEKRTLTMIVLATIVWAVIATGSAAYYYLAFQDLVNAIGGAPVRVDVLLDYGNGTRKWPHNGTVLFANSTVLDALLSVTKNVKYDVYPYGVLITEINGVKNVGNTTAGMAWMWYYWDWEKGTWTWGPEACDKYVLGRLGTHAIILWNYTSYSW